MAPSAVLQLHTGLQSGVAWPPCCSLTQQQGLPGWHEKKKCAQDTWVPGLLQVLHLESGAPLTVPVRPKSMPSMTPRRLPATQLPLTVCRAGPKWKASVLREWRRTIWIAGPCRAGTAPHFIRAKTCCSRWTRDEGLSQKSGATSAGLQAPAGQAPPLPSGWAPAIAAAPEMRGCPRRVAPHQLDCRLLQDSHPLVHHAEHLPQRLCLQGTLSAEASAG